MIKAEAVAAYAALMTCYPLTIEDLDGEQWRDIPNYEGLYQESTFGRTKSLKRKETRIMKPTLGRSGYLQVQLSKYGKTKHHSIHRLVSQTFIPNPSNKPQVNHKDGHPLNCHISNLEWVTNSENQQHAITMGIKSSGEDHTNAKLTNAQAYFIRNNPGSLSLAQLADMFGVQQSTIERVQLGKTYKSAGGLVRGNLPSGRPRIPDAIRNEIRQLHIKGDLNFGSRALAKKYSICHSTVLKIINEK